MSKLRIFLSGPMTGYENFNFDRFNFIENVLKQYGVDVVNPVHICKKYKKDDVLNDKAVFDKMIAEQQEAEKTCNAILLLHDWQYSNGVKLELKTAANLDFKFFLDSDVLKVCREYGSYPNAGENK